MKSSSSFILLRHGQSQWNLENRFTGWTDVPLTELGRAEALEAARLIRHNAIRFDIAWTSVLERAVESLDIVLGALGLREIEVQKTWRLNERHYGSLQGLNKAETAAQFGEELVMSWRRSYSARPPALEMDDPRHPSFDERYAGIPLQDLPRSESLQDTEKRIFPLWQQDILPAIQAGRQVLIVAHGNSLRALVRYLEEIPPIAVPSLVIPTGIPQLVESLDHHPGFRRHDLSKGPPNRP